MMNNGSSRGRFQPYRGNGPPVRGRGRGRGRGTSERTNSGGEPLDNGSNGSRGRGRGTSIRNEHQPGRSNSLPSNRLVPVKPTTPSPSSTMTWRVLYAVPASSRPEIGPSGEKIPGPFSPPLRPVTPDGPLAVLKSQDKLRKENDDYARKHRVQQLLQQAANSSSGGMGTYVGKLSKHNNPLIPVLPRPDQKQ